MQIKEIKQKILMMAQEVLKMWQMTHRAFMEHNRQLSSDILKSETVINNLEREISEALVVLGKSSRDKKERLMITSYIDIVGDLEMIGDYCKDILERIEIKIEERLFFSDDAVRDYNELYDKTEGFLKRVVEAIVKDDVSAIKDITIQEPIDKIVEGIRSRHDQRLINGICSPFASNMFLNIVDFTIAVFKHTQNIANNLLKIEL